jgi:hypothetical protein
MAGRRRRAPTPAKGSRCVRWARGSSWATRIARPPRARRTRASGRDEGVRRGRGCRRPRPPAMQQHEGESGPLARAGGCGPRRADLGHAGPFSGGSAASMRARMARTAAAASAPRPSASGGLVHREAGRVGGDLEQHAARLAEIDRVEVLPVDHRRHLRWPAAASASRQRAARRRPRRGRRCGGCARALPPDRRAGPLQEVDDAAPRVARGLQAQAPTPGGSVSSPASS